MTNTVPALPDMTAPRPFASEAALKRLRKRRAAERRFKRYGQIAIGFAIAALVIVMFSIVKQASPALTRHDIVFDITLDENIIAPQDRSDASAISSNISGFNALIQADLRETFQTVENDKILRRELYELVTRLAVLPIAKKIATEPDLIGTRQTVHAALSDDLDLFLKGGLTARRAIDAGRAGRLSAVNDTTYTLTDAGPDGFPALRETMTILGDGRSSALINFNETWFSLISHSGAAMELSYLAGPQPTLGELQGQSVGALVLAQSEINRTITDHQIAWTLILQDQGRIERRWNTDLLFNADSTYPELAGVAAAMMGSFFTMIVTALFALPVGVMAAVYLEEFAPKNRLTRMIEVNINNLAAVPSIIFGLLGAAVFINVFGMPRSVPFVGGLVLGLLVLPTIIIASRAALKSVPPSIRTAALGLGASRSQTVFHHVVPLATPGILTGAIIAMARALGETAPLLLIGMVAFINQVPSGPNDEATVLPVLIYKWFSGAERAWEPMTAMAIIILLAFLMVMNLTAVILRRRFEKRW